MNELEKIFIIFHLKAIYKNNNKTLFIKCWTFQKTRVSHRKNQDSNKLQNDIQIFFIYGIFPFWTL